MFKVGEIHLFTYPNIDEFVGICLAIDGLTVTIAGVNKNFILDEFNFNQLYCQDIELDYKLKSNFKDIQKLYNDLKELQKELILLSKRKLLFYRDDKLNLTSNNINSKMKEIKNKGDNLLLEYLKIKENDYGQLLSSKTLSPLDVKKFYIDNSDKEFIGVCVSYISRKYMPSSSEISLDKFCILLIENDKCVLKYFNESELFVKPIRFKTNGLRESFKNVAKLYKYSLDIRTGSIDITEMFQYSLDEFSFKLKSETKRLLELYEKEMMG